MNPVIYSEVIRPLVERINKVEEALISSGEQLAGRYQNRLFSIEEDIAKLSKRLEELEKNSRLKAAAIDGLDKSTENLLNSIKQIKNELKNTIEIVELEDDLKNIQPTSPPLPVKGWFW